MQVEPKPSAAPNWGCPEDCQHDFVASNDAENIAKKEKDPSHHSHQESSRRVHGDIVLGDRKERENSEMLSRHSAEKDGRSKSRVQESRKSRTRKKKTHKSIGLRSVSSESVSDLVSRTIEECEKQLRSSSLSLSSIPTSFSLDSSESEGQSSSQAISESSSVDIAPNQRVVALGQMAQKLTSRITEEEENLRHRITSSKKREENVPHERQPAHRKREELHSVGSNSINNITVARGSRVDNSQEQFNNISLGKDHVPYSEIQMLSVEELKARMTAMLLPGTSRAQGKSSITSGTNDREPQGGEFHEGHAAKAVNQDSTRAQVLSPQREEIPSLLLPDTPRLHLHGVKIPFSTGFPEKGSRVETTITRRQKQGEESIKCVDGSQERLSELPGNNIDLQSRNRSSKVKQSETPRRSYLKSEKNRFESAALRIQAAYKGYRVRKVTNYLLKNESSNQKYSHSEAVHEKQHKVKSPKSNKFVREMSGRSLEGDKNRMDRDVDWQKIREELGSAAYVPRQDPSYVFQRNDLPEWVKPYMLLSESGNVGNFLKSSAKSKDRSVKVDKEKHVSIEKSNNNFNVSTIDRGRENNDRLSNSLMDDTLTEGPLSDSDKENNDDLSVSMMNDTLTEGPIAEAKEKLDIVVSEKETQTPSKPRKQKALVEDRKNEGLLKNENLSTFVELKSQHKKSFLLNNIDLDNTNISKEISAELSSSFSKKSDADEQENGNETSVNDDTLEEGPFADIGEEKEVSKIAFSSVPRGSLSEVGRCYSSEVFEMSDVSKVSSSEDRIAPHQLLGKGPHFGPANLRLRLNAELTYQDTVNEALNQLHGVEQLHILAKNREKEFAFAQSWSAAQQREQEAYQKAQEEKQREAAEKERKEAKQFRREELRIQQETLSTVERIEREAKERLDQLERDVRARAEQIMVASQRTTEHNNSQPEFIATAAVAAVGATLSHWERLKHMQGEPSGESQSIGTQSQKQSSSYTHDQNYSEVTSRSRSSVSRSKASSNKISGNSGRYTSVSENISLSSQQKADSSVPEDVSTVNPSPVASSVEESVHSEDEESTLSSVSEIVKTSTSYKTSRSGSEIKEVENVTSIVTSESTRSSESVATFISKDKKTVSSRSQSRLSRSRERSPALQFKGSGRSSSNISEIAGLDVNTSGSKLSVESASGKVSAESVPSEVYEASQKASGSGSVVSSDVKESIDASLPSVSRGKSSASEGSSMSQSIPEHAISSKSSVYGTSSKKSLVLGTKSNDSDGVCNYSESFEVESISDGSVKAINSSPKRENAGHQGDMSLVVAGNLLHAVEPVKYKDAPHFGKDFAGGSLLEGGGHTALGMTLNLVESLQKEEEVRLQHQTSLLKLQVCFCLKGTCVIYY